MSAVLPLDPVADLHVAGFMPGLDPDATIVGDPTRPLAFYDVTAAVEIRVSKSPSGIFIDY